MAAPAFGDGATSDPFGFMQVPYNSGPGVSASSGPGSGRGGTSSGAAPMHGPPMTAGGGPAFWDPHAGGGVGAGQGHTGYGGHGSVGRGAAAAAGGGGATAAGSSSHGGSYAGYSQYGSAGGGGGGGMGMMGTMAASSSGIGGLGGSIGVDDEFANEPPLLQELGVDFSHIRAKVWGVLNITKTIDPALMSDADMAGPLVFALVLGFALLCVGKLHFGYIYGFGGLGCMSIYLLVNLMADPAHGLDVYRAVSILGYCLLPIVMLAAVAVAVDLRGPTGGALGLTAVLWCTQSATRFFEGALAMRAQRYLIAYPALLLYACFALITIF